MGRIDRETVQKILDAADIVEVVSDFVHLKRRGANYMGLCPFHNERTPSFSVSKSKGICRCFSCGKGGSAVGFIMELEQMTYPEALRYLAKKYNIEIVEHEMSDAEREAESARESMMAINEFAADYFRRTLTDTEDGRNIGLAYFRERGINDAMIERFKLGYSLEGKEELYKAAIAKGYSEKYLIETGLCYKQESTGKVVDRFRGRVIYPVQSMSGRVVAFGGRTLRTDKQVAKYVNSPESLIYHKSNQLYGLYQAKQSIAKKDNCILVEGYMDVISMHQSGVENVVASSGTSLTSQQVSLIHRFTENVTVIYDSDAAGIKASLRGIDMLLAEGLNVKVLLLPDGDDPDSFAQSHTSTEVEEYLKANATDFINFKTRILLEGTERDPIKRAKAIEEIVKSIAVIPKEITRTIYIQECSRRLEIDENVLLRQVNLNIARQREKDAKERQRQRALDSIGNPDQPQQVQPEVTEPEPTEVDPSLLSAVKRGEKVGGNSTVVSVSVDEAEREARERKFVAPYEKALLRYVVRYGMVQVCEALDAEGNTLPMNVVQYVTSEMENEQMSFLTPLHGQILQRVKEMTGEWVENLAIFVRKSAAQREEEYRTGVEEIKKTAGTLTEITASEKILEQRVDEEEKKRVEEYTVTYVEKTLASDSDDNVRRLAVELATEKYQLSRVHTKYAQLPTELDRLPELVSRAVLEWKFARLTCDMQAVHDAIAQEASKGANADQEKLKELMTRRREMQEIKREFARELGDRVLSAR